MSSEDKAYKIHKIFVNTRSAEIDAMIRKKLINDFGNISKGAFIVLSAYVNPDFFRNILKLEEVKREVEITQFRSDQLVQLERENKLLTNRIRSLEKEIEKEKNYKKGAIK